VVEWLPYSLSFGAHCKRCHGLQRVPVVAVVVVLGHVADAVVVAVAVVASGRQPVAVALERIVVRDGVLWIVVGWWRMTWLKG
jgi:hypothetical protein